MVSAFLRRIQSLDIALLWRWGTRGGIAILDQGLFSGSNFVINVLLARWLDITSYGAYSIGFALFLFFTGLYNSLILEPMAVLGLSNHRDHLDEYIANQFKLHFLITLLIGIPMSLTGWLLSLAPAGIGLVGQSIMGAGLFLPLVMLIWLVRRVFYILQNPIGSVISSTIYMMVLLGGGLLIHWLVRTPVLSLWFGLLGVAGLVSGVIPVLIWKRIFLRKDLFTHLLPKEILIEHWSFGRWVMVATIFNFVATQIQIFATASILSLNAAGIWRAIQNFALPMVQGVIAIATLSMPVLALEFGHSDYKTLNRKGLLVTLVLTLVATIYELILFLFSSPLEQLLYGGKFSAYIWLIPVVGLVPVLAAVESGFSLILRVLQRPVYYLIYTVAMLLSGLLLGPLLIWSFGLTGAAISQVAVGFTSLIVSMYLYKIWFRGIYITTNLKIENGL